MARFTRARRLAPGDIEPVLDLPLAALRIAPQTAASLARVGLRTVGCIAYLPRAPLVARFGEELARRLDQALGRADEPLSFLQPVAALMSEKRFSEPIAREDDIRAAIAELCAGAVPSLERRGQGARQMSVKFFRVDGEVFALGVHAANPLRDPVRMAALFEERLAALREDFDAGYGFDMMRLDIMQADTFADAQGDILDRRGEGDSLARLIDRLGARLGADRVRVFAHADTHVPERGFALVPLARARGRLPRPGSRARTGSARRGGRCGCWSGPSRWMSSPRFPTAAAAVPLAQGVLRGHAQRGARAHRLRMVARRARRAEPGLLQGRG